MEGTNIPTLVAELVVVLLAGMAAGLFTLSKMRRGGGAGEGQEAARATEGFTAETLGAVREPALASASATTTPVSVVLACGLDLCLDG